MDLKSRVQCRNFFILCVLLEFIGFALVIVTFVITPMSVCVLSGEVSMFFAVYMFTAPIYLISDLVLVVAIGTMSSVGMDPLAIVYNFVAFIMCVVGGFNLILVLIYFCGNIGQFLYVGAGVLTIFAGLLHLLNAKLGNEKLSEDERQWPAKRPHREKARRKSK